MKTKLIFSGFIFTIIIISRYWALPDPSSGKESSQAVVFEVSTGLGSAVETKTGTPWKPQLGMGLGAHYYHAASQRIWLHAGFSEQFVAAYRMVEHPYPYVMEMKVSTTVNSTRFRAGCDYALHNYKTKNDFLYTGVALYADVVHDSEAYKRLRCVDKYDTEEVGLDDSFAPVVPGLQVCLGTQFSGVRLELRYWEDMKTFRIPTVPIGRQRRTFFGLNGSYVLNL